MTVLAVGDKITRVARGRLLPAYVHRIDPDGFTYGFRANDPENAGNGDYADEGVEWIRGHHTAASDEGKALLATAALTTDQTSSWTMFGFGFAVTGVTLSWTR